VIPEFELFNMGATPWARRAGYELRSPLSYLPDVKGGRLRRADHRLE
jgi:hypothetical protein